MNHTQVPNQPFLVATLLAILSIGFSAFVLQQNQKLHSQLNQQSTSLHALSQQLVDLQEKQYWLKESVDGRWKLTQSQFENVSTMILQGMEINEARWTSFEAEQ